MAFQTREDLIRRLQEVTGNNRVKLPGDMDFTPEDGRLTIALTDEAIGAGAGESLNMQENDAAFESWALICKAWLPEVRDVRLRRRSGTAPLRPVEIVHEEGWNSEHYMRFLYRAMKFKDAYGEAGRNWFRVEDADLEERVEAFRAYMEAHRGRLQRNKPSKESIGKSKGESRVEKWFSDNPCAIRAIIPDEKIDRLFNQLPVGVFKGEVDDNNSVFTGGGSAIDLWARTEDDKLLIFELKTRRPMAGIITELMFYCNLMQDTYVNGIINPADDPSDARGFGALRNFRPQEIVGYMLTDRLHPLINGDVLQEMSKSGIQYKAVHYDLEDLNMEEAFDHA